MFDNYASGNTNAIIGFDNNGSTLVVSGKVLDKITYYGGDPSINASLLAHRPEIIYTQYPRMIQVFHSVSQALGYEFSHAKSPKQLMEMLSRTIIANRRINDHPRLRLDSRLCDVLSYRTRLKPRQYF